MTIAVANKVMVNNVILNEVMANKVVANKIRVKVMVKPIVVSNPEAIEECGVWWLSGGFRCLPSGKSHGSNPILAAT